MENYIWWKLWWGVGSAGRTNSSHKQTLGVSNVNIIKSFACNMKVIVVEEGSAG